MTTMSPPISPQRPETRPRAISNMSYVSNRSRRSSHSANKLDLTENARDKKRLDTKADPRKALSEAQPAAVALEESNLENIRLLSHKDLDGNVITDPDRSNPTRHRLERPLDTIRAFNAAAEGTSSRRSSYQNKPAPQYGVEGGNHRGSYYGSPPSAYAPQGRPRPGQGGYYRNSSYGMRPGSFAEEGPPQQYGQRPMRYPSVPYAQGDSPSSTHSHQPSYETMTSGSEEYGKSTNPSSQNSSFDRLHQVGMRKPDEYALNNPYDQENMGSLSMNGNRPYLSNGMQNGGNAQHPYPGQFAPLSHPNNTRQPIKLTTSNSGPPPTTADLQKSASTKRQSWIKRKFSRRDS